MRTPRNEDKGVQNRGVSLNQQSFVFFLYLFEVNITSHEALMQ